MNAKEKAIKQIQKEVMSNKDMMNKFVEEIEDEHNLYCRAIDIALKEVFDDLDKSLCAKSFPKEYEKIKKKHIKG